MQKTFSEFINENKTDEPSYVKEVYEMLKNRELHPSGKFDNGGRFYAKNDDLINVRSPSRAFPYSQLVACRTLKYVRAVQEKFKCKNKQELINNV